MDELDRRNSLAVSLTVDELKALIREQVLAALQNQPADDERLLDVHEAAELLGCSEDWVYANAKTLPFTRRLGKRALRFSKRGLRKWLASRRAPV